MQLEAFLSAYDPSDLPGGSIDPLGFDRSYSWLAERLLPGLTTVADRPRYLSLLTAALDRFKRFEEGASTTPQELYRRRVEATQRAERFWTLACVLAHEDDDEEDDEKLTGAGIRGISYVGRAVARLKEQKATSTAADFRLLSRQATYGLLGIYGSVADGLGLIERKTLDLGPDLGRRLAEAFIEETAMPDNIGAAIARGGEVSVRALKKWGRAAHINRVPGPKEGAILREVFTADAVRERMSHILPPHEWLEEEHELDRLARIHASLEKSPEDADLREAIRCILAFENCFRLALLIFQQLLGRCQNESPFAVDFASIDDKSPIGRARSESVAAAAEFDAAIDDAQSVRLAGIKDRLNDVRGFVSKLARSKNAAEAAQVVLERHQAVQRAKRAGGRPKMPWLEIRNGKVVPTMSFAQRIQRLPLKAQDVLAHPYRTAAADKFLREVAL